MAKTDLDSVMKLLPRLALPPSDPLPGGVDQDVVATAAQRLGMTFPQALVDWLGRCNGPCVGPGGLFGVETDKDFLDIEGVIRIFPGWVDKNWIPVAGDGCGNYYVLVPAGGDWPVAFVDASSDPESIAFLVASSLPVFLKALLEKELGANPKWPFDQGAVLKADPRLEAFRKSFKFPWGAT